VGESVITELQHQLWLVFAVFLRIGPAIALSPGYGANSTPPRVKLVLALILSAAIVPVVENKLPSGDFTFQQSLGFALTETVFGFFMGLVSRGVLLLLEQVGIVISQVVSLAQLIGNSAELLPVIGHILTVAGLALIMAGPLGDQIIFVFAYSYHLSIGTLASIIEVMAEISSDLLNYIFNQGVAIAGSFITIFFVYYLFTGFVNKAMPQFMVSFVGIPFVALLSIVYLHRNAELILTVWQEKSLSILMMPFEALK
jgi:flagellar biosynthetic protein FliR